MYKEHSEKEKFKTLLLSLLESRSAFRKKDYTKAQRLAEKIIKKAEAKKHELIIYESNRILKAISK